MYFISQAVSALKTKPRVQVVACLKLFWKHTDENFERTRRVFVGNPKSNGFKVHTIKTNEPLKIIIKSKLNVNIKYKYTIC